MAEPDWLRLQKKIFGRYIQQQLRGAGVIVEVPDVIAGVKDGSLLINLMEALSGHHYTGKKPTLSATASKIQQIDAANKALDFAKSVGVKTQTSAEDIVNGNEKLILGMIFQIILKFMKIDEDDGSSNGDVKEALLLWLKNKTAGYSHVSIENFTKSFHDGLAPCALIHKMRPKLIPYDTLVQSDKLGNLGLALDIGEKYCNVAKYLEPADIAKLDEVSMIVYLSDWYYGVALLQKQDISAKRIGKLVLLTELHDKMRAEYTAGANALIHWLEQKIQEFSVNHFDNTLEGVQKQLEEFYDWKSKEKSTKLTDLLNLETLFDNLALRLANNKRPAWKPDDKISPEGLSRKFEDLEKAELEKAEALHAELARQIQIINDRLCQEFAQAVKGFTDWLNAKKTALKNNKENELEKQLSDLDASTGDHANVDTHFSEIGAIDEKIKARLITHNKFTNVTKGDCHALWAQYLQVVEKKRALLLSQIEEKKKSGLTDEQLLEIKDNFVYFDKDKTNFLERRELRACLKSLGEDATPQEVDAVIAQYDLDKDGKIAFEEFQQFMFSKLGDTDSKEEIGRAFKYLSYDQESVKVEHLENVVNDISWKQRHVDYLKKEMKPKDDGLDWPTWTEEVFNR